MRTESRTHSRARHRLGGATPRFARRPRLTALLATLVLLVAGLGITVLAGSPASATEETFFPDVVTPPTPADRDRRSVELGLRFSVTVPGTIVGVRYFGTEQNTGKHTGSLWSSSGRRIATATFPASDGKGWQSVDFDEPVHVTPGRTYVASYFAPSGRYAVDDWGFTQSSVRGHLAVPRNAGVYLYGARGGFPRQVYKSSNYYVDVRFVADEDGTETPTVTPTDTSTPDPTDTTSPDPTDTTSPDPTDTTSPDPTDTTSPDPTDTTSPDPTDTTTPDPTPTDPTTTPTGSPTTGCASAPSDCGYPDETNTGVEPGVDLRAVPGEITSGPGWRYSGGVISVTEDGAIVSGISTTDTIDVTADNVTIKNVRVVAGGETFGIALRHTANATIDHVEITAPAIDGPNRLMNGVKDIYGDTRGTVVQHSDISRTATGIQMATGTIRDNYIHDLGYNDGDHVNGTTSNGGTTQLNIQHNTVFNQRSQTDAISLFQDFGTEANRLIENNLVAGGGYTIYAGANGQNPSGAVNIVVRNNRFARLFYPRSGYYGPVTSFAANNPGNVWSGNVWDDTGAAVTP